MGDDKTGGPRARRDRGDNRADRGVLWVRVVRLGQANASARLSVRVHFFPLASLLKDRLLVALGVSVTTVALVALVAGLATDVAPSTSRLSSPEQQQG